MTSHYIEWKNHLCVERRRESQQTKYLIFFSFLEDKPQLGGTRYFLCCLSPSVINSFIHHETYRDWLRWEIRIDGLQWCWLSLSHRDRLNLNGFYWYFREHNNIWNLFDQLTSNSRYNRIINLSIEILFARSILIHTDHRFAVTFLSTITMRLINVQNTFQVIHLVL